MNLFLWITICVVFIGIMGTFCLFSCILASNSDKYWEQIKKELEEND